MSKIDLLKLIVPILMLVSCSRPAVIIEYPPLDWAVNAQRLRDTGCLGNLQESCPELVALGCDAINAPGFYLGGLQPPYAVMECIHENGQPPNPEYFKQPAGLDSRYRSYAIHQQEKFKLIIKKSEFKEIFAPVESTEEALSYAMAMTSLKARFDLDASANIDYLVDVIEETHAEYTPNGYLVYLFDWSHKMGCDNHPFYAVKVLVTQEGDVHEMERQEIYRSYACFDFEALTLEEN
ncbi:MAG: hypothetical protein WHV66_07160 [Anaerolineales bacterium]|jgi:hypothetical protein